MACTMRRFRPYPGNFTRSIAPHRLADGTPFRLGMVVFLPAANGDIKRVDSTGKIINTFVDEGTIYNMLDDADLSFYYPTREAALDAVIGKLESSIQHNCAKLARLQAERKFGS